MIILEPKAEHSSQATPSDDPPPSYSEPSVAGGSRPKFSPTLPPPAMVSSTTDRSMHIAMTPREEALIGEEYHRQLLARCAQGNHEPKRHYGILGIVFAVILFPVGLLCLVLDSEQKCARCQVRIE
ncbi:hypothetical protein PILCRDRAFT_560100 [Piloderma croceum F 1598]|uniref:Uncharacterized protein n=1 Tax=Piloderma croceum (strain F 1598) TaxID=765440 RepID=A0A0C3AZZ9_PILCF|nr:hypothetical protein PILCRDRAFT_560100 [Piloderma croceum F 1598]